MLALLFGCGFRRSELVGLELDEIQMRQGHWAVVDLIDKGGHIRTVPILLWVKAALDGWTVAAGHRGKDLSDVISFRLPEEKNHVIIILPKPRRDCRGE
jgi:integrase